MTLDPRLRVVLDAMPARVSLLDRAQIHRYANADYADLAGRPICEILGRSVAEILGPAAYEALRPEAERALAGETVRWEGWMTFSRGHRLVQRVYIPYRTEAGDIEGYFVFARDLTELKSGEWVVPDQFAALQANEAVSSAITASALDCIIAIDDAGMVIEFNPAAEKTFGYRRSETIGRPIVDLIVPPALRRRHIEGLERYLRTGEARVLDKRIEIEGMRADGSTFPVELSIKEVRLPHRRLFTAYLRDLTPAHEARVEIERQREALHQSEKLAALGSLLAGVSHELNNPLSILIGNALILQTEAEGVAPSLAERAQRIQAAAERCGRIVRSFLAMARQRKTQPRAVAVEFLIGNALQLLAYGLRAAGIEVTQNITPDLPLVMCDPDQMTQVLTNLLVNAQQALEGESRPRRISLSTTSKDGAVFIEVADNGPGVPAELRSRVFDPFFTTKPVGSGTGIGLAVSRGIVEAHGGALTLAASERGAHFVVRLPLQEAKRNGTENGSAPAATPARSERTALVVDDEKEVGQILSEMLKVLGIQCDVVTSGQIAIEKLTKQSYDVIITDVRLPGIDGPALYAWIAQHKPELCTRTAFVTGDTLGRASERFLADTKRPLLEKPFLPSDVRRLIEELLRANSG
ncbi:MAG TPA: PAS domain S-box protein [Xanthobacteraceae bacterium]|nr:PAS domain S-box protein [Xanthobacteraceae bacterium]